MAKQFSKNPVYQFPGHEREDIEQEAIIIGLMSLDKFDETRANLKTFLYMKMHTKLLNLKRDKYFRPDTKSDTKEKLNNAEQLDLDVWEEMEDSDRKEYMRVVDNEMPYEMRDDWNRLKEGIRLKKPRREQILREVRKIIYGEI